MAKKVSNQVAVPKSMATLIVGLLSMFQWICCMWTGGLMGIILAIVSLNMAASATELYEYDPESYTKKSMTLVKVGKIAGWLGLLQSLFWMACVLIWMMMFDGEAMLAGMLGLG